MKYTIDRMGLANFKAEVEKLLGYELPPPRPYEFLENVDLVARTLETFGEDAARGKSERITAVS